LSLASFRNAWQLDKHSQAALRFLVDWYNGLALNQRVRAPEAKVLLSIASRLPQTGAELARIKGVPRRWAAERGDHFTGQLVRATAEASHEDFVPIEPPAYANFEEIRVDGWLALARAEISAKLGIAPELGLPTRLLRQVRHRILESGDPKSGVKALVGWRAELLGQAYLEFCDKHVLCG
jgi:ribonuclease D